MIYLSFVFHIIRCVHYWQKLLDVLSRACESDSYNYIPKGLQIHGCENNTKSSSLSVSRIFFSTSVSVLLMQNRNF